MQLATLRHEDIPLILELESQSAPDKPLYVRYDQEALAFIFNNPDTCDAVGVFDGKKLIGWGAYRTNWKGHNKEEGVYEISSIVVDKDSRGKGLGTKILQEILKRIQTSQNYKSIYLTVSPQNIPALLLYLKNGFIICDYQKDVYGPDTDRVFLSFK